MRTWLHSLLLVAVFALWQSAWAGCPIPEPFSIAADSLPATKQAIEKRSLTVLALGGAATLGRPADGAAFTYPSRLEARLTAALPNVSVNVVVSAVPREATLDLEQQLDTALAKVKPALVIWGTGASAAGRGDDLDTFVGDVTVMVDKIRAAGGDLILMTLQYAPSVARVINLFPYRTAVLHVGGTAGVPVLDRYELMRYWSDNDFLDLDATRPEERIQVARKLYDCMAEILAAGIVDAVR